jgi:hypothetical protein
VHWLEGLIFSPQSSGTILANSAMISFPLSRVIFCGSGYRVNHIFSAMSETSAVALLGVCCISNQPVTGSIMVSRHHFVSVVSVVLLGFVAAKKDRCGAGVDGVGSVGCYRLLVARLFSDASVVGVVPVVGFCGCCEKLLMLCVQVEVCLVVRLLMLQVLGEFAIVGRDVVRLQKVVGGEKPKSHQGTTGSMARY